MKGSKCFFYFLFQGFESFQSEGIRRILFILAGPDEYRIPNRLAYDTIPLFYDSLPIKSIGNKAGIFYRDFVNFDEKQYFNIRSSGSSVLTKALTMPLDDLKHLITWASNGKTVDQIAQKVDTFVVPDLHWIMDATYIYTEKSGESMAQRCMYSGQKK